MKHKLQYIVFCAYQLQFRPINEQTESLQLTFDIFSFLGLSSIEVINFRLCSA